MSNWIDVKDRLPEEGSYLCFMKNGYVKMCYFENLEWRDMWQVFFTGTVTHWQPLPEPPTS